MNPAESLSPQRDAARPVLLFICGMSGTASLFRRFHAEIDGEWDLLTYEHYGPTDAGCGRMPFEDMAQAALDMVNRSGTQSVVVCGESFGGPIAQHLARLAPDRIAHLFLISTFARFPSNALQRAALAVSPLLIAGASLVPSAFMQIAKWIRNPVVTPSDPPAVKTAILQEPPFGPAIVLRKSALAARFDSREWLKDIRIPTTVICGKLDRLVRYECSLELAGHLPNARLWIVPDAGHLVLYSKPEVFRKLLAEVRSSALPP